MKTKYAFLAGLALTGAASVTQAGPIVTEWEFDLTTVFDNVVFSPGSGSTTNTGTLVSWGVPAAGSPGQSSLALTNNESSNETIFTNGAVVPTVTVTHNNNPIISGSQVLSTASLVSTLTLRPVAPSNVIEPGASAPVGAPDDITLSINFEETPNNGLIVDDIFVLTAGALNNSFTYDDNTYQVSSIPLTNQLNSLDASLCSEAGAAAPCIGWLTEEEASTSEIFGLRITTERLEIPSPAPLALIALGLLGLGARRQRA